MLYATKPNQEDPSIGDWINDGTKSAIEDWASIRCKLIKS